MQRNTGIVIQARVGSSRLPGKVLQDVVGTPLVGWVIERAKGAIEASTVICAVPAGDQNAELASTCASYGADVVRGSERDVLSRFIECCNRFDLTDVVRITGDCPLIDPRLIDRAITLHRLSNADITANLVDEEGGFPRGMDVEVIRAPRLRHLSAMQLEPHHREHVTLYFYEHPELYCRQIVHPNPGESRPDLRLCVDYAEDLELVRRVCCSLRGGRDFSLLDIVAFLDAHALVGSLNDLCEPPNAAACGVPR